MSEFLVKKPTLIFLFFLLLIAAYFPGLWHGRVLSANDILYASSPFSQSAPEGFTRPHNYLLADQPQIFYALKQFLQTQLQQGVWPRWMPYIFSGHSFVDAIQSQAYHPQTLLLLLFPVPVADTLSALLRIFIAGVGMWLFLRQTGSQRASALIGGVAFMFCSYTILWLNHIHTSVSVMIPWLLYAIQRLMGRRPGIRDLLVCAAIVYLTIAGAHPNTIILTMYLAAAYTLYRGAQLFRTGNGPAQIVINGSLLIAGVTLGCLMLAVLLVPFIEARLTGVMYYGNRPGAAMIVPPVPLREGFLPLLLPRLYGTSMAMNDTYLYNFIESSMFAGVTVIMLCLMLLPWGIKRPDFLFFAVIAALVASTLLGVPLISDVVRRLPLLRDMHIQRTVLLMLFSLIVCATIAWDQFAYKRHTPLHSAEKGWLFCTGIIMLLSALRAGSWQNAEGAGWYIGAILFTICIITAHLRNRLKPALASILLALCVYAELHAAYAKVTPAIPLHEAIVQEPAVCKTMKQEQGENWFRIAATDGTLVPNTASYFEVRDIRGYEVPISSRYISFLSHAFYEEAWPYELMYWHCGTGGFLAESNRPLVNMLGVKYILSSDADGVLNRELNPAAYPHAFLATNLRRSTGIITRDIRAIRDGFTVIETTNTALQTAGSGIQPLEVTSESVHRYTVQVQLTQPGVVVLNEVPQRGWRATINGMPADPFGVNIVQLGVIVPAGNSVVTFDYLPKSFQWGLVLSAAGFLLFIGLAALSGYKSVSCQPTSATNVLRGPGKTA